MKSVKMPKDQTARVCGVHKVKNIDCIRKVELQQYELYYDDQRQLKKPNFWKQIEIWIAHHQISPFGWLIMQIKTIETWKDSESNEEQETIRPKIRNM